MIEIGLVLPVLFAQRRILSESVELGIVILRSLHDDGVGQPDI